VTSSNGGRLRLVLRVDRRLATRMMLCWVVMVPVMMMMMVVVVMVMI